VLLFYWIVMNLCDDHGYVANVQIEFSI
jgi:hypothetical protein